MSLETRVNRALMAAHLLERVIHDPQGWAFVWGPHVIPAEREIGPDGAVLRGEFPETCWLEPLETPLLLMHEDTLLGSRMLAHPGDGGFEITWSLSLPVPEPAL